MYGGVRTSEAADSLRERGIEPLTLDVTRASDVAAAAETIGGTLDGLVDNAGIAIAAPLELVPLDELRRQLEVNVVGQVAVAQAFLPALRRARGRIVLMGSIGGRSALPFLGPYAASKHALEAVADSLRVELRPWGIAVSIVEPASIATAIWQKGATRAEELRAGFAPESTSSTRPQWRAFARSRSRAVPARTPTTSRRPSSTHSPPGVPRRATSSGRDARIRAAIERLPTRLRDRVLAKALTG